MLHFRLLVLIALFISTNVFAADSLPYRGLAIAAPSGSEFSRFTHFVEEELVPRKINLLVLRVDYSYEFESHPELRRGDLLSKAQVKELVAIAKKHDIRLIPQINLLGHQSWATKLGPLLEVYPQFDETPHVEIPDEYSWPNNDGLYCKSYCPLHPDLHEIVFALIDEICDAFESDAFHAGMDEVFYIGDDQCPRCAGKKTSELFAGEITKIRNHLAENNRELWIWGDRLLDADTTGLGMWEASANETHHAINLIPKDVVINDWHYNRAEPTPIYFATKGFRVMACPWNKTEVALDYLKQTENFRATANPTLAERHLGVLHTYWGGARGFMDLYEGKGESTPEKLGPIDAFKALYPKSTN